MPTRNRLRRPIDVRPVPLMPRRWGGCSDGDGEAAEGASCDALVCISFLLPLPPPVVPPETGGLGGLGFSPNTSALSRLRLSFASRNANNHQKE
jgi:hypothetical protein